MTNKDWLLKNLGDAIRKRRLLLSASQEAFAEKCMLHRTYIGAVERGERNLSLLSLQRIAKALDCTVSDLIREAEKRNLDKNQ